MTSNNASRLFIISEFIDGTQNSTGYYWSKIIEGLSRKYELIYVIGTKSSHANILNIPNCVSYVLVNDFFYNKKKTIQRFWGQFFQSIYFAKAIIKNIRCNDVVISGTNPALLLFYILFIKVFFCFKWILLVHDVFPENLIPARIVKSNSLVYKFAKILFDRVYLSADILISIGRDMLELLAEKTNGQSKIEYVPNWVDLSDVVPLSRECCEGYYKNLGVDKIVFQFFGNLGRLQGIKNILDAIALVKNENAFFVFIGTGSEDILISNFIKRNSLKNIVQLPAVQFSKNNSVLSSCDVSIVSLESGMSGLCVPSKAYFSLAADKPLLVISDIGSELSMLISEEKSIGWFCESGDSEKLASLIDSISSQSIFGMQGKARDVVVNKYGYENAVDKYSKCVSSLLT